MRRLIVVAAITLMPFPAFAQSTPAEREPGEPGILARYAFRLSAEHLSSDDQRFVWDTHLGGDVDMVDYVVGRATFYADYQAVLGEAFRHFDPEQGNYTLGGVLTLRLGAVETGAVFHHVSRHLSDRPKRFAIDWNMLGGRVRAQGLAGGLNYEARGELRGVVFKSYVDYRWEAEGDLRIRRSVRPAISLIASSGVRLLGTDGSGDRGTQVGFREEGGVRLEGRAAAAELFVAVERRIDPDPLEFSTATWLTVGFRLVNK